MKPLVHDINVVQVKRLDDFSPGIRGAMYYLAHKAAESPGKFVPKRGSSFLGSTPNSGGSGSVILGSGSDFLASLGLLRVLGSDRVWTWDDLGVRCVLGYGRTGSVFEGRIFGQRVAVKVGERGKGVDIESEMENEIEVYRYLQVRSLLSLEVVIFFMFKGFKFRVLSLGFE